MVDPEYIDDTPWYANKGIPLGIIIYLIIATISATAYLTNLADRIVFLEAIGPVAAIQNNLKEHAELTKRLAVIEAKINELQKDLEGKK